MQTNHDWPIESASEQVIANIKLQSEIKAALRIPTLDPTRGRYIVSPDSLWTLRTTPTARSRRTQ